MQLLNMLITLIIYIQKIIQISKKHNHYTQIAFPHQKKKKSQKLKVILLLEREDPVQNSVTDLGPKHSEWNQK